MMGAIVGYARVSTSDQDHKIQIDKLTVAGATKIFAEKLSLIHILMCIRDSTNPE